MLFALAMTMASAADAQVWRGMGRIAGKVLDEAGKPIAWPAFAWVSAALIGYGLLVERAGFVLASTLLFVLVARGFDSRRWLLNALTGAVLAVLIFAIFNYGLGLTLPAGVLKGLL